MEISFKLKTEEIKKKRKKNKMTKNAQRKHFHFVLKTLVLEFRVLNSISYEKFVL